MIPINEILPVIKNKKKFNLTNGCDLSEQILITELHLKSVGSMRRAVEGSSMRFGTVPLPLGESPPPPPRCSGDGVARGSDHSPQGQRRYRGRRPCCQDRFSLVWKENTAPAASACLQGGS